MGFDALSHSTCPIRQTMRDQCNKDPETVRLQQQMSTLEDEKRKMDKKMRSILEKARAIGNVVSNMLHPEESDSD